MKRKIMGLFTCLILIVATVSSVTGTKMSNYEFIYKNELTNSETTDIIINWNYKDSKFQNDKVELLTNGDVPFYAYNAYDPSGTLKDGPVYFYPQTPDNITLIAPTTSNGFISGATWTNDGKWYGCEHGGAGDPYIWIINNETGDMTLVGSYGAGISFNGLAYDPTSGIMYGCSSTNLYTVNMTTGASTIVGSFGLSGPTYMIGIAFDNAGNLYGNELTTDSLYEIDTSDGSATLIGEHGIDITGGQDMAYDNSTNTLYLSAYTMVPVQEGALYTCDTSTGAVTKIGTFQGAAEITGFAIPYENGGGPPPQDEIPPTTSHTSNPSEPNGDNGWYVSAIKVTINATDDDSGVAWTNYTLNNGMSWITHYGPEPFDFVVGEGEHQLLYYSVDKAGNVETLKGPFHLNIDTVRPDKRWSTYYVIGGPVVVAIICFGAVKDGLSGVDRVEFYLNDTFHHKMDLSVWPVGLWCPIFWFHTSPGPDDVCSGIVYDKAGNWREIKPQSVPNNINNFRYRQRKP